MAWNKRPVGRTPTDRTLGSVIEFASRVLAPATILTAVLYYFGYIREEAMFAYFGVDLGSLDFSTTDYLVRSAGTLFLPLALLLVLSVVAVAGHYVLLYILSRAVRRWRRIAWIGLGAVAITLLTAGAVGLYRRYDPFVDPLLAPIALGLGAVLLEYAVETARANAVVPARMKPALDSTDLLRRAIAGALSLVAVFWATSTVAQQRGTAAAREFELTLSTQPQAVVYSRVRLQITGPGVSIERLDPTNAAFAVRYNGLRTLVHTNGRWFLLPAGWNHDNGATVILLPDSSPDVRVDLAP
jgi:hypothetical protein